MQKKIPVKYILVAIAGIATLAALVDVAIHGGDIKATTAAQIAEKVISATTEPYKVVQPPVPPAVPYKEPAVVPFSITNDPTLLSGEGFFYVENGVLYRDKLENGVATVRGQKIAEGVQWVLAQNEKQIFFTSPQPSPNYHTLRNDLWVVDKETGTVKKIYKDVHSVAVSPKGDKLAVQSAREINIIDGNGNLLSKVTSQGLSSVFSNNGNKIAYGKLGGQYNDHYAGVGQGIAVYDVEMGTEIMFPQNAENVNVLGFSSDNTQVYFSASVPENKSGIDLWYSGVWSVDMNTGQFSRFSEEGTSLYIGTGNALRSSDGTVLISTNGDIVSLFKVSLEKKTVMTESLGVGASPRWKVQDREVEFKTKDGWMTVDISSVIKE